MWKEKREKGAPNSTHTRDRIYSTVLILNLSGLIRSKYVGIYNRKWVNVGSVSAQNVCQNVYNAETASVLL